MKNNMKLVIWIVALVSVLGCALISTPTPAIQAIDWIQENNKWGADAPIAVDFSTGLDKAITDSKDGTVTILVGWGLTKSGQAYRLEWTPNDFQFTALTPDEAQLQGFKEMDLSFIP